MQIFFQTVYFVCMCFWAEYALYSSSRDRQQAYIMLEIRGAVLPHGGSLPTLPCVYEVT